MTVYLSKACIIYTAVPASTFLSDLIATLQTTSQGREKEKKKGKKKKGREKRETEKKKKGEKPAYLVTV